MFAIVLFRQRYSAEGAEGGSARVVGRHTLAYVLFRQQGKMGLNFPVKFLIQTAANEKSAQAPEKAA
jgi:hypothetical protein